MCPECSLDVPLMFPGRSALASVHVLVKRLETIETLGAVTVLASDKTGTLTQNKMAVVTLWLNHTVRSVLIIH
jgi:P-type E1-E2 ATPase